MSEGKIVKVSGKNVTIYVSDKYEITLPTKTMTLVDDAVIMIGRRVEFKTQFGQIVELRPTRQ